VTTTLSITKAGTGLGIVTGTSINCGSSCSASYAQGTAVNLTATPASTPAPGSSFASWSGDADCSGGSVTMNTNKSCIATFNLKDTSQPDLIVRDLSVSGTLTAGNSLSFSGIIENQGASLAEGLRIEPIAKMLALLIKNLSQ